MSSTPAPIPASEPAVAPLSQGARIVNTFIAPSKTFNDLRRSASWWAPWLLIAIVTLIFAYSVGQNIGWGQVVKNGLAQSPKQSDQFERLPPDQQAKQTQVKTVGTKYFMYALPFLVIIVFLIMAGILMGTFNLGMGASVPFKASLAIVVYSGLPGILHSILASISLFVGGTSGSLDREAFDINNPAATNPAYFMDPMGNKFLYVMASSLDIFVIWGIILMGIGFACNSKVKKGTAIGTVAGWYLIWKLFIAGIAVAFS